MVDILIPFPCLPQPRPPKSMLYFGPSSLSFSSDNIDLGGEGIYGILRGCVMAVRFILLNFANYLSSIALEL